MAASKPATLLFVSGDRSGVGKSSVCLALLGQLLRRDDMSASDLAYIKPATQCEDVQLVSKWCEARGIAHRGLGPVRFYQGFTSEVINEEQDSSGVEERHRRIREAVADIAKGKRFVLVDGVGYAAVGSCVSCSNSQIAQLLNAPVLVVGRPGIGNAIDSYNMIQAYFETFGVRVLGCVTNNIPEKVSYHTYETCRDVVGRYFEKNRPQEQFFGAVPRNEKQWARRQEEEKSTKGVACILRETAADLALSAEDEALAEETIQWFGEYVNVNTIYEAAVAAGSKQTNE